MSIVTVRTLAVSLAILGMSAMQATAKPRVILSVKVVKGVPMPKPRPNIVTANTERLCMARAIYAEARNQPRLGRLLVGYSVKRRSQAARREFGGAGICKVISAKTSSGRSQYSGISASDTFIAENRQAWDEALSGADELLAGYYQPEHPWSEVMYYLNPNASDAEGRCWFRRQLVEVGWFKDHLFYREPADDRERLTLLSQDLPIECLKKVAGHLGPHTKTRRDIRRVSAFYFSTTVSIWSAETLISSVL